MVKKWFGIAILCAIPFDAGVWMVANSLHYFSLAIDRWTSNSAYTPQPMGYVADIAIGIITVVLSLYFALYFLRKGSKMVENQ